MRFQWYISTPVIDTMDYALCRCVCGKYISNPVYCRYILTFASYPNKQNQKKTIRTFRHIAILLTRYHRFVCRICSYALGKYYLRFYLTTQSQSSDEYNYIVSFIIIIHRRSVGGRIAKRKRSILNALLASSYIT